MRVVLLIAAFTIVMAGPNLPTPLLPGYRASLGLDAFGLTVLFSVYLVALVVVLGSAGWVARRSTPRALLVTGLLLGVASDLCFVWQPVTLAGVLSGRVLSGVAVGISTGAAAVLLRHHGGGRSASATALCALLGSAAGTALTALLAEFLPLPRELCYLVHAAVSVVCVVSLWVIREFAEPARADARGARGDTAMVRPDERGRFAVASAIGMGAWVTAGLMVALVPTYAVDLLGATSLVVAASPVVLYLGAACLGSMVAGRRSPRTDLVAGPLFMAIGLALTALSGPTHSTVVLALGAVITGIGQGLAFRGGLFAALTVSDAARQGVATSTFSAVAYFGAAATTLGMGLATGWLGLDISFRWASMLFGAAALVLGILASRLFRQPAGESVSAPSVVSLPGGVQ